MFKLMTDLSNTVVKWLFSWHHHAKYHKRLNPTKASENPNASKYECKTNKKTNKSIDEKPTETRKGYSILHIIQKLQQLSFLSFCWVLLERWVHRDTRITVIKYLSHLWFSIAWPSGTALCSEQWFKTNMRLVNVFFLSMLALLADLQMFRS